jgi:hypothetical protein
MRNKFECTCEKCGVPYMAFLETSRHCPNHRHLSSPRYFQRQIENSKKKGVKRTEEEKKRIRLENQRARRRKYLLSIGRELPQPKPVAQPKVEASTRLVTSAVLMPVGKPENNSKGKELKVLPEATFTLRVNAKTVYSFTSLERREAFIKKHPELFP